MKKHTFLGISGTAGSGKDLFCKILLEKAPSFKKYSLANKLKEEMREPLLKKYDIDILNCSRNQKDQVRHELVSYGASKRRETQGRHWIEQLNPQLKDLTHPACITDIRYDDYDFDEAFWLKNELGGLLIHISRFEFLNNNKKFIEAPNEEERRNNPKLKDKADYLVEWPSFEDNIEECAGAYVDTFLQWLNGYNESFGKETIEVIKEQTTDLED